MEIYQIYYFFLVLNKIWHIKNPVYWLRITNVLLNKYFSLYSYIYIYIYIYIIDICSYYLCHVL